MLLLFSITDYEIVEERIVLFIDYGSFLDFYHCYV